MVGKCYQGDGGNRISLYQVTTILTLLSNLFHQHHESISMKMAAIEFLISKEGCRVKNTMFFVTLIVSPFAFANTTSGADNTTSVQSAIHSCYGTQGAGICLQSVLDKEKKQNSQAWTQLADGLKDTENKKEILENLTAGKQAWEVSIRHDCEAAGLLNTKDSPAYNNDLTACLASQYSSKTAFYRRLNTQVDDTGEKKRLEEYRKSKKK